MRQDPLEQLRSVEKRPCRTNKVVVRFNDVEYEALQRTANISELPLARFLRGSAMLQIDAIVRGVLK